MTKQEKWVKKFGAENVYNKYCEHFRKGVDKYYCKVRMDMTFCGSQCAYATNVPGSTKVNKKGTYIGV